MQDSESESSAEEEGNRNMPKKHRPAASQTRRHPVSNADTSVPRTGLPDPFPLNVAALSDITRTRSHVLQDDEPNGSSASSAASRKRKADAKTKAAKDAVALPVYLPDVEPPNNTKKAKTTKGKEPVLADLATAVTEGLLRAPVPSDIGGREFYTDVENKQAVPALSLQFSNLMARMPPPRFQDQNGSSHAELVNALRQRNFVFLPMSDADHESELLIQANVPRRINNGRMASLPVCGCDDKCEGLANQIEGLPDDVRGYILPAWMTKEQLAEFKNTGLAAQESKRRMCVLCARIHVNKCILAVMQQGNRTTVDESMCFQFFRNPVTGPAAYRHDVMMQPPSQQWQGYCDLIVKHQRDQLRWVFDDTIQLWRVNQDKLIVQKGEIANAAPPLLFQTGAASPTAMCDQ